MFNPSIAKHDFSRFNSFYKPIKSQLLETKWTFKNQALQMFGLKLNKYK